MHGLKRQSRSKPHKPKSSSSWRDMCPLLACSNSNPAAPQDTSSPRVSEEDEYRRPQSVPNTPSSCPPPTPYMERRSLGDRRPNVGRTEAFGSEDVIDISPVRRRHRPVGLTGVEDLSLEDALRLSSTSRPATNSPFHASHPYSANEIPSTESSPDAFNTIFDELGVVFDFPNPPSPSLSPLPDRAFSPAPSLSSSTSSSTSSSGSTSTTALPLTPATSEDELSSSQSAFHRGPLSPQCPPIRPLTIANKSMTNLNDSYTSQPDDYDDDDDGDWYAREVEDILTLYSPAIPNHYEHPSIPTRSRVRPDSFYPSQTPSRRPSGAIKVHRQLDPSWREPVVSPPAVPAIEITPPTKALRITIPDHSKPPPRMDVPADVDELFSPIGGDAAQYAASPLGGESIMFTPALTTGSVYSQPSARASQYMHFSIDLQPPHSHSQLDSSAVSLPLPFTLPASPVNLGMNIATGWESMKSAEPMEPAVPDTPAGLACYDSSETSDWEEKKMLRSRWSSSTIGSIQDTREREHGLMSPTKLLRLGFTTRRQRAEKGRD